MLLKKKNFKPNFPPEENKPKGQEGEAEGGANKEEEPQ